MLCSWAFTIEKYYAMIQIWMSPKNLCVEGLDPSTAVFKGGALGKVIGSWVVTYQWINSIMGLNFDCINVR